MSKFTKGKWSAIIDDDEPYYSAHVSSLFVDEKGKRFSNFICDVFEIEDARLISSAPDLYEACKHTVAFLDHAPENVGVVLDMLKAALAKANGRNQ